MTRQQRRRHLAVWLALAPLLGGVLWAALRERASNPLIGGSDSASAQETHR
jgi:hypothetical protein